MPTLDTTKIHGLINEYCHEYIPAQEITHAANEICKNPTEDTVLEMTTYLNQFDKEFVPLQTVNTKALTSNQVRYGMAEVRKVVQQYIAEVEEDKKTEATK